MQSDVESKLFVRAVFSVTNKEFTNVCGIYYVF